MKSLRFDTTHLAADDTSLYHVRCQKSSTTVTPFGLGASNQEAIFFDDSNGLKAAVEETLSSLPNPRGPFVTVMDSKEESVALATSWTSLGGHIFEISSQNLEGCWVLKLSELVEEIRAWIPEWHKKYVDHTYMFLHQIPYEALASCLVFGQAAKLRLPRPSELALEPSWAEFAKSSTWRRLYSDSYDPQIACAELAARSTPYSYRESKKLRRSKTENESDSEIDIDEYSNDYQKFSWSPRFGQLVELLEMHHDESRIIDRLLERNSFADNDDIPDILVSKTMRMTGFLKRDVETFIKEMKPMTDPYLYHFAKDLKAKRLRTQLVGFVSYVANFRTTGLLSKTELLVSSKADGRRELIDLDSPRSLKRKCIRLIY